jgi:hypothetical protein
MTDSCAPLDKVEFLNTLAGVDLAWESLLHNYTGLRTAISRAGKSEGYLQFSYLVYVDSPLRLSNVRFRMATPEESSSLPQLSFPNLARPERTHLVLEADEGTFSIWCGCIEWFNSEQELPTSAQWQPDWPYPLPVELCRM